jgi:hypothetical protein
MPKLTDRLALDARSMGPDRDPPFGGLRPPFGWLYTTFDRQRVNVRS